MIKTESLVKKALTEYEETRGDNFLLVYKVYELIDEKFIYLPFLKVMLLHKEFKLPSFETIVRCRRKLQAEYEELRPSKKIQEERLNKTADYIDYAINGYIPSLKKLINNAK